MSRTGLRGYRFDRQIGHFLSERPLLFLTDMMQRTLLLSAVALGVAALAAPRAQACSCTQPPPPTEALAGAAAVFEGSFVGGTAGSGPTIFNSLVQFQVLRAWKGVRADSVVTIATPKGDSAGCGFGSIEARSTWLVYAHEVEGALTMSICSRTQPIASAASDVAELGPPVETGTAAPGTLGGSNGGAGCTVAGARPWRATAAVCLALALLGAVGRRRRRADR